VARWFRRRYVRVSGFPLRGSEPQALLRLHLPLIEPDGRISRIRLSDKDWLDRVCHAFARGRLRFSLVSRTNPNWRSRWASG